MLHISGAYSGWVGRVVSPHGERLVWGFMWLDMGWVWHKHVIPNHSGFGAARDSEWPHVLQVDFLLANWTSFHLRLR
ncbi:hypothetical protein F383_00289 [Gossypium arboreum]|uniref:Uncharacterized protein n=1 Tax=Gossypium arboreum TaxID=29729 RepID=A0A0B0P728_GOSAR|nr:hypothetical protein F383_00289 [Gossypium arboreum]